MKMFRTKTFAVSLFTLAACLSSAAVGQSAPSPASPAAPVGFVVPEWKSADGKVILRLRGRVVHDFYDVDTDLGGTAGDVTLSNNSLRAVRFGIDGQFSPKVRFRADANLIDSQVNWADVFLGYTGSKYEAYVGQQRLATTLETLGPDVNYPLPETSLVGTSFGQSIRKFGAIARVKGTNWQTVAAFYTGDLNAGDVFGDDALHTTQVRSTYAFHNKDRDVVHVGASVRVRDARDGPLLRYATRPAATNFGPRSLDSGAIASSDTTVTLEGLWIKGSFMLSGEHQMLWADTARGTAAIDGTYIEACYWLTGEYRRYQAGTGNVTQVRPKRSVRAGGLGAIGLVARADRLDQTDARFGTRAGGEQALSVGVAWLPVDFVTFRLAASQTWIDKPLASQSGSTRVIMGRAQFAF
jgi:phosphate-selective porin